MSPMVTVVGAGLAGCEAALQLARRGVPVRLVEMRPERMTEAHRTGDVAELVCSNSLKSEEPRNAHGLLKAELRLFGSALLPCAEAARIPGGKALVADRQRFSAAVQRALDAAGVVVERREATEIGGESAMPGPGDTVRNQGRGTRFESSDSGHDATGMGDTIRIEDNSVMSPVGHVPMIVATGPLTSPAMVAALEERLGAGRLFFFDAIAPVLDAESLDRSRVFAASRYGAGDDYLNSAMTEPEYNAFIDALLSAELHPMHDFESGRFFEGCLPIEEMARRGRLVPAFGPMKPVGIADPATGRRPFAVVQLRRENAEGTMYNLVGFQTRLKHGEQERVIRMIPGLERARFLRFGSMHRNTFLDAPRVLGPILATLADPALFIAGQLTGVEGYVESIAAGLVAGVNTARVAAGQEALVWPAETMTGALLRYVTTPNSAFQPMNANFGLLPPIEGRLGGRDKRQVLAERALSAAAAFVPALRG